MLLASQFDLLVEPITALFQEFEESVIRDIARRLAGMDYATPTAAWQVQRLSESGMLYERILSELSRVTGRSQLELRRMFRQAGVKAMAFDDAIYRAAGLQPVPLNLSPAMGEVLAAGLRKTGGIMNNLTMTTALSGQQAFESAADLAYMQISSGAFSYQQAICQAVKQVAADGLDVIHFAKRTDKLDVAMRRTVLTGVGQTVGELTMARAEELGTDLVQTSAHIGARNKGEGPMNHESWQGQVYSRTGNGYPDFVTVTGYGTGEGLHGWNCRHSYFPFFEGISAEHYKQAELDDYAARTVTYNGKEMSVYEATQEQRAIERKIRYWKRQRDALEAAGLDNDTETAKVRDWQAQMRDFIGQTGLQRQRERERVFHREPSRKTIGYSFLSGETHLTTTAQARELGNSTDGWDKHEQIFREKYLEKFNLKDDVDRTIGFWGGPEPSFNAYVLGKKENVIEMAKAWGRDFSQQAVALLFPNKNGKGGKLIWRFGDKLSDTELDLFFRQLDEINQSMAEELKEYFGVTVKHSRSIEYWFENTTQSNNAFRVIDDAIRKSRFPTTFIQEKGFDFVMLWKGDDY